MFISSRYCRPVIVVVKCRYTFTCRIYIFIRRADKISLYNLSEAKVSDFMVPALKNTHLRGCDCTNTVLPQSRYSASCATSCKWARDLTNSRRLKGENCSVTAIVVWIVQRWEREAILTRVCSLFPTTLEQFHRIAF